MKQQQWCAIHWAEARKSIEAGTHSGIGFAIGLQQAWLDKRASQPDFPKPHDAAGLNALLDADSPVCCWLGQDELRKVFDNAAIPGRLQ